MVSDSFFSPLLYELRLGVFSRRESICLVEPSDFEKLDFVLSSLSIFGPLFKDTLWRLAHFLVSLGD